MSRVYQKPAPAAGTTRRPAANPQGTVRPTLHHPQSTAATRGVRAPIRGQTMRTSLPRPTGMDNHLSETNQQRQTTTSTTHVGDGFHMITPSMTKREQMMKQAEAEQRQYEEHRERTRLRNIHEVHRLGGDSLTEQEARQKQAEKYRREKFERLEKMHKKQVEEKQEVQGTATGWTDETREADRKKTMDQFFDRLTNQCENLDISSTTNQSRSEKLAILQETLPHIDEKTLEAYLESYNGNIDGVLSEFLD